MCVCVSHQVGYYQKLLLNSAMMEVELDLWSSRSDPVDHMLDDVDCCADVDQYLSKHDDEVSVNNQTCNI